MRMTEAMQYLPAMGINPLQMRECAMANCTNAFMAVKGVAFEGRASGTDEVHVYFFCSYECYLNGVPKECCGRA